MAESSAKRAASHLEPGGKSTFSAAADTNESGSQRLSKRLRSLHKNPTSRASSKTPTTPSSNASPPTEEEGDGKDTRGLPTRPKPEGSSAARTGPSTAHLITRDNNGDPSTEAGSDCKAALSVAVPIAELWNLAYEQLRAKEPKLIAKYEEELSFHVSTIVGATVSISGLGKVRRREQMEVLVKQKLKEDEDGKWRIPLGQDRIAIRDLAGHVVSIVDWGVDFVSTALRFSPYGSIAWAGVCLLLPLILNPSKQRISNVRGLEYISDLLSRCTMYEYVYHKRYETARDGQGHDLDLFSDNYKSALQELYLRILRFQARTVCQFSRNPLSGGVRAMFKIDDWDALLDDVRLQEVNCQRFFESCKDQEALEMREEGRKQRTSLVLDRLEGLTLGIKGIRDKLEEIHISDEESKCFETLRTSNYLEQKDLNPKRLLDTCRWFFDHPKYKDWIAPMPAWKLLWVSANPGCGKSVLAKTLVDQYYRGSVCYYFFKDDTVVTRSAAHAICAILHQICDLRPDLIKYVLPMHRKNGAKLVDSFEDLWSVFVNIIGDKDFGNVTCILDAVDECSNNDQKKLLQRLASIATSSSSIKILITSRPYKSIETALFHETGLDKNEIHLSGEAESEQSLIEKEIGFFVTFKIKQFQKIRESSDIYDDAHEMLHSFLGSVKNRTYLWVSAVFNELERDSDAPDYILKETIMALPETVDKAYENILRKCLKPRKPMLIKVLHIMLAAFRPLSLVEMNVVLSIQDTPSGPNRLHPENSFGKWLRDLCGFFVNIVDNKLYFAHQTAREFLIGEHDSQSVETWRSSFYSTDSHTVLAQICIDYLLLLYDGSFDARFETYATRYWPSHCQKFEVDPTLANKVKGFLFQKTDVAPSFIKWTLALDRFWVYNRNRDLYSRKVIAASPPTPLFLACIFGWISVIRVMMTFPNIDWDQRNKSGQTSLHVATQKGHLEIVKLLLAAGTGVNIQNFVGETALYQATAESHLEIVKLLLAAGADVNIRTLGGETAFHRAIDDRKAEIVEVLLAAGSDVNIQDHWKKSSLRRAAEDGSLETVKLLLTAKIDPNEKDMALYAAKNRNHAEIVETLLAAGAVDSPSSPGAGNCFVVGLPLNTSPLRMKYVFNSRSRRQTL